MTALPVLFLRQLHNRQGGEKVSRMTVYFLVLEQISQADSTRVILKYLSTQQWSTLCYSLWQPCQVLRKNRIHRSLSEQNLEYTLISHVLQFMEGQMSEQPVFQVTASGQSDAGQLVAVAFLSISLPDTEKRAPPLLVAGRAKHDSPFSLPQAFSHKDSEERHVVGESVPARVCP